MHPSAENENATSAGYATRFSTPLLDPERAKPDFVTGPRGKAAVRRYAVYRNNVTVSLIEALADNFPAVLRIVGDQFFRDLARVHVRSEPPTSPLLFEYGHSFADFIDGFEHTRSMPWLGDVARIERAWLDAYHAADAEPLDPSALGDIAPENLAGVRFVRHPAAHVLTSQWPAVTIFSVNRKEAPVGRITERDGEDALITRPATEVFVRKLPLGGACFLRALMDGVPLGEAAAQATANSPQFDLAANISGMLEAGVFSHLEQGTG